MGAEKTPDNKNNPVQQTDGDKKADAAPSDAGQQQAQDTGKSQQMGTDGAPEKKSKLPG